MLGLITDRSQSDVDRLKDIAAKGWHNMTAVEKAEWIGDILTPSDAGYTGAVNLLPSVDTATVKFRNKTVTASKDSFVIVGKAADFVNKTLTLSVDELIDGTSKFYLYWYDGDGESEHDEIGGIVGVGSKTLVTGKNANSRAYLALLITAGEFVGVMLEAGSTRNDYVPYTPALPTAVRKGAYNYSDFYRIEKAVTEIAEELGLDLTSKTDWTEWDIPKQSDVDRVLGNIRAILKRGSSLSTTPALVRSMEKLTYAKANDIEKIISDVADAVAATYRFNDIYCGEV